MIFVIVMSICALIMINIGVFQVTRKMPVTFYTGERIPDVEAVKNVKEWNIKHGIMWIFYGGVIIIGIIAGILFDDTIVFYNN